MKIAFIAIKGLPYGGGIEKFTEKVASGLAERGHQVVVYAGFLDDSYAGLDKNIKVITIPSINTKSLQKISLSFISTLHLLKKGKMDIVHFHSVGAFFAFLPKLRGIRSVVQIHSLEWKRAKWGPFIKKVLKISEYPSISFPDKTVVVSKVLRDYFLKEFGKEVIHIPTGVDSVTLKSPNKIKNWGLEKDSYILFASRLVKEKGLHYLLDAYNSIQTDKKLVVAGDGSRNDGYVNKLKEKTKHNENVLFLGFVYGEALEELFSNAYLYVLPSELEGFPISLLEAMGYGNCCLVSDIPENLETLNGYGYSFRNKDSEDLQRQLEHLLTRKDLVNAFKEKARKYVLNNYSWDKITDQLESLYLSLVNLPAASRGGFCKGFAKAIRKNNSNGKKNI